MFTNGIKYWYTLNALRLHEGMISQTSLECYTNYPILPLKSHIPFKKVMRKFVDEEILVFNNEEYLFSPKFHNVPSGGFYSKTIDTIKNQVLVDFNNLLRKTGIISYDSGEMMAEYGKYRWAFKGVSPIIGLRHANGNFGYVLADILIGKPFYHSDVLFFISKIKQIQSFKNAPKLIPFLIVDNLHVDALEALKKEGIAIGFINELFGSRYAETLKDLISIFNNVGASLKSSPEKYLELIDELKKYNRGLLNNIRGALFEYLVGHIHVTQGSSIEMGWEIIESNARHEIDILAVYGNRVVIAECKSRKSHTEHETVSNWITKKIPAFRKWFEKQETYRQKSLEFEYWSTSGYEVAAKEELDKFVESYKKHKVSYFGPLEIRTFAKQMKNKKLKESLDNFFLQPKV